MRQPKVPDSGKMNFKANQVAQALDWLILQISVDEDCTASLFVIVM